MGQAGSHAPHAHLHPSRRAHTLPHEPLRHAPKVLPSLTESPRLRSTDNGAILQSGGTISGRRPVSHIETRITKNGHMHNGVYRSRSAGATGEPNDLRSRERDPLHRSHTNLDLRSHEHSSLGRFGSEPDLRVEEEPPKPRCTNKHFRKKYRAPPPPTNGIREGSSPESSERNTRTEPPRKLRLFKTRTETKKLNGHLTEPKVPNYRNSYQDYKSLDLDDVDNGDRRYKFSHKNNESHLKYPDSKNMVQSSSSLKREDNIMRPSKYDYKKPKADNNRVKTAKSNDVSKTPLLNRNFRYSDRFKKEDSELPPLRREKSFDATLIAHEREADAPKHLHASRMKAIGEQLKANRLSPLVTNDKALKKSLPSLLSKNNEKDEFQTELKKATNRIRKDVGGKVNLVSENSKTSQNVSKIANAQKPNPTKISSKVKESSLRKSNVCVAKQESSATKISNSRRPVSGMVGAKSKAGRESNVITTGVHREKLDNKVDSRGLTDRGQASGKESTPDHSPIRKTQVIKEIIKTAPSKQFYFGMNESRQAPSQETRKDFPGLGSPIIEEISNFHLIEQKLLGYHEEDEQFEKFNAALKEDTKIKNLSSESALSSEGSEAEGSDGSLGIALRLRPTLPKKMPAVPRFSPAAAWRQLANLDAQLTAECQPLTVETSPAVAAAGEPSGDKSGDSGISGDHDNRLDSPSRQVDSPPSPEAWTPQQDLGDSSSEGARGTRASATIAPLATFSARAPFSLSLPRDDKGKQLHGFNSLQKLKKSVSGALGAALGSRRFDLEHEPVIQEPEQNWFLTKSAPNSLTNPMMFQSPRKVSTENDIKEEASVADSEKEDEVPNWRGAPYLSWGGHVMYLPPAQPLSIVGTMERPTRSKSSSELEVAARAARARALAGEMRERERSASPPHRALPARVDPAKSTFNSRSRGKRFTFQSTVRQLERRKIAEKLSREAELKEQQRRTELEAMRRVEEEFQRKRAREKANIRQQLRLVSGSTSLPPVTSHKQSRDSPDGSASRESLNPDRDRDTRTRHSNTSSEISARSKSATPVGCVELSEYRQSEMGARLYRDWGTPVTPHPPATARMPRSTTHYHPPPTECSAFSGSPRSDNYRLEFARGVQRSPRTPRPPRLVAAPRSPSTSGSELSHRQPIRISAHRGAKDDAEEPIIIPTLRPAGPTRPTVLSQ